MPFQQNLKKFLNSILVRRVKNNYNVVNNKLIKMYLILTVECEQSSLERTIKMSDHNKSNSNFLADQSKYNLNFFIT